MSIARRAMEQVLERMPAGELYGPANAELLLEHHQAQVSVGALYCDLC